MSTVTILDHDRATLWYHPEAGIVHHAFKRPVCGRDFRVVLDTGIELLAEHGARKWLSDDRNNSSLTPEDSEWAMTDWQPRAIEVGWEYWAVVLPESVVGQMNMSAFIHQNRSAGVQVQIFTDPLQALAWLESVK